MAETKNLVPRVDGEGGLGTSTKKWKSLSVTSITASADISASGTVYASTFESAGSGSEVISFNDNIDLTGNITASGDISGSTTSKLTIGDDIDSLSGSLNLQGFGDGGHITASGDITSSGNIRAATSVHTKTVTATSGVSASKILSSTSIQLIADNVTLLPASSLISMLLNSLQPVVKL